MFRSLFTEPEFWSVSELTIYLRQIIERDDKLQDIWVQGEISNLSQFENVDEEEDLPLQQNAPLGLKPNASKIKKSPLPSVVDDSNEYGEILKIRK